MTEPCASCGGPLLVGSGFCEACGGRRPGFEPVRWVVEVRADNAWFERAGMSDIAFPDWYPLRRFVVAVGDSTIGRRSARRGIEPEIDLSGTPEDPGVSRLHAVLIVAEDGSLALVDMGSTNGTWIDGASEPIEQGVPVRLDDGGTFHIGAWTAITVRCDDD